MSEGRLRVGDILSLECEQLLTSSLEGYVIGIRYCIKQGAGPNTRNPKNNSALLLAAHHGHCSAVDALIKYKADVHACNDDGGK